MNKVLLALAILLLAMRSCLRRPSIQGNQQQARQNYNQNR